MNRRDAIQKVTLMLGGVMAAPLMAGAMGQVTNFGGSVAVTAEQEILLSEIADIIIPTTGTPGAKAAGVEKFIVRVVRDCYEKIDQEKFYAGLAKLDADSKTKFGKNFVGLDLAQKNEIVKQSTINNKSFFTQMKGLTVTGYFTSEIGATQALEYLSIPGRFDGCMPMKAGQKTWA
ncbi:gluconate 2-dehydrogenase subunit 3 family protein [Emticicia sp.]|uniref:gluconate 2-dehydrogenase subunit 3 family protein n=1 Tax=Emticicia sp. TaxID=1930953 RepID=UPI003750F481